MLEKIHMYLKAYHLLERFELCEPITVEFLAQGEYNQNFLISDQTRKFVFRLNYGSQLHLDNQVQYEYQALKWLERTKRTPKVYYVDDHKNFFDQGLLIMEYLAGSPLDYRSDLSEAAKIFGKIHQQPLDETANRLFVKETQSILSARTTECEQLLDPVFKSNYISKFAKHQFDEALDWCKNNVKQQQFFIDLNQWCVTNTEVNSHNFIIGQQSFLIDWEKPVISHAVQDISQFLASTTTLWRSNLILSQTEKEQFIQAYLKDTHFDNETFKEALHIYHPYLMLRALSWSAMAYDSYQTDTKELQNQEIFAKVKSYLQKDFLQQALKEQIFE
ncbi:aminoglycoside phosphotransferase family protein [Enterococcus hermanniensis]|uniref:Aminoglycoside phosphotransferase domain-containing protein n=1 Tax=Enterococcus hermanniensis TaxID=249189 RepID=A0A1L8TR61_9ENTE|nr:aminoglycoside phosphotransferase family protein [Enterococcus hermanniensis]OJG46544.1 hypothetical protein RV04_GL000972 [Enterococcus hermanniensis]